MSKTPCCDECERRIRSQIGRRHVDGQHRFCTACNQKIHSDGLTPGEDYTVGKLWETEDEGEEDDDG